MSLRIEEHAPGHYVISGYHPQSRLNKQGQTLVTHEVCQIVFADEGQNNGVTPEILMELLEQHTGNAPAKAGNPPVDDAKKQAMRDRMAAARASRGKKTPEPALA